MDVFFWARVVAVAILLGWLSFNFGMNWAESLEEKEDEDDEPTNSR